MFDPFIIPLREFRGEVGFIILKSSFSQLSGLLHSEREIVAGAALVTHEIGVAAYR